MNRTNPLTSPFGNQLTCPFRSCAPPHNPVSSADLSGADLPGADLGGANVAAANLSNANLASAKLIGTNLGGANLGGANMKNTSVGWTIFGSNNISGGWLALATQ